jgi:hypothetical protein
MTEKYTLQAGNTTPGAEDSDLRPNAPVSGFTPPPLEQPASVKTQASCNVINRFRLPLLCAHYRPSTVVVCDGSI